MCTKEEVQDIIRKERLPLSIKYLLGGLTTGAILLLSWILLTVHKYDGDLEEFRNEVYLELNAIRIMSITNVSTLTGNIALLTEAIKGIKEIAFDRSKDRYTGTQAKAREILMDERCDTHKSQIKENKEDIQDLKEYHLELK